MGYLHIENLYKAQDILLFKECYALEKVHGTSAHISYHLDLANPPPTEKVSFFSGGESHVKFKKLFDEAELLVKFRELGHNKITVYGEAYGGSCQGMSGTYGKELKFIVFDVQIDQHWLNVPNMHNVAAHLGLEVVPWRKISTELSEIDGERDRPSEIAHIRGMGADKEREGVVLRPLIEVTKNDGSRIIAKHKGEKFEERATPQKIVSPERLAVLEEATAIADEWVTDMRLTHVLDKLPRGIGMEATKQVIDAMVEDVLREAAGEIVDSKEARNAIGRKAAALFKQRLQASIGKADDENPKSI